MSGIKIRDKTSRNLEDQVEYLTSAFQSGKLIDELGIKVLGVFSTIEQAKAAIPGPYVYGEAFQIGNGVPYNLYIFTRNIEDFFNFGPFPAPGKDGTPASFGNITATINAQEGTPQVTVTKSGPHVQPDLKFNFFNLKGPEGRRGTIKIGTTITGQVGTGASVVNVGTDNDAILQFTLPKGETGAQGPAFNIYGTLDSTSQLPEPTEALRDAGAAYIIPDTQSVKHLWVIQGPENGNLEWVDIGVAAAGPVGPTGKDGVGLNTISQISDIGTRVVNYDTNTGMTVTTTDRITYTQNGESITHDTAVERDTPIVFGQGLIANASAEHDKVTVKANISKIQASNATEFVPDENGVVTIPAAQNGGRFGLFTSRPDLGLDVFGDAGWYYIVPAGNDAITARSGSYNPLRPASLNFAVKAALTDDKRMGTETSGTNTAFTDTEKDRACDVLGASRKLYKHFISAYDRDEPYALSLTLLNHKSTAYSNAAELVSTNLEDWGLILYAYFDGKYSLGNITATVSANGIILSAFFFKDGVSDGDGTLRIHSDLTNFTDTVTTI